MSYYMGTVSHSTTGVKTRTIGFQATAYRLTVKAKSGGSTFVASSEGLCDGTNSVCDSSFSNQDRAKADRYTDRVVFIREWNSGTSSYDTKTQASHDSITATEVKYNVTTADVDYQYLFEAWN